MRYWDSSAIVPLLVREQTSTTMQALFRSDPGVITWWGSQLECVSAIARRAREPGSVDEDIALARRRLLLLRGNWSEVTAADDIRVLAETLLSTRILRTGDALQLASALAAAREWERSLAFVCLDDRLRTAAAAEGLALLP